MANRVSCNAIIQQMPRRLPSIKSLIAMTNTNRFAMPKPGAIVERFIVPIIFER